MSLLTEIMSLLTTNLSIVLATLTTLLVFILGGSMERVRESRQVQRQRVGNLSNLYFEEYWAPNIQIRRENISKQSKEELSKWDNDKSIIARSLQRIALMSFTGGIPLQFSVTLNGLQIVSDWVVLYHFLREDDEAVVPALWRHAEWLALVCWLRFAFEDFYLVPADRKAMENFFNAYGRSWKRISKREKRLRKLDSQFMGADCSQTVSLIRKSSRWSRLLHRKPLSRLHDLIPDKSEDGLELTMAHSS